MPRATGWSIARPTVILLELPLRALEDPSKLPGKGYLQRISHLETVYNISFWSSYDMGTPEEG